MKRDRAGWILLAAAGLLTGWNAGASESPEALKASVRIHQASEVEQGIYYWSGSRDASLSLQAEQKGDWLILEGVLWDDVPFVQKSPSEMTPGGEGRENAGDGIGLLLRGKNASGNQALRFGLVLEFGPHATKPRIRMRESEIGSQPGTLNGTTIKFNLLPGRTRFRFQIPLKNLLKEPYSLSGCELEVRLYDLDEDDRRFTLMSGKTIFSPAQATPEASPLDGEGDHR